MSFGDAIRTCLRKYATFSGRASRSEYWYFVLFIVLGGIVLGFVDRALFGTTTLPTPGGQMVEETNSVLGGLFSLATLIPAIAAGWRRMHDTGRSGLFLLYPLIAMVGVFSYVAFVTGIGPAMAGQFGGLFVDGLGVVMILAMIVLLLSPLIVIWWLTRPTQPETNQWGPPPQAGAA